MSDPKRLRESADASELALLETLRADAPSDEARVAMWSVIAAQAGAATIASTAGAAGAKGVATKLSAAVATKAVAAKVAVVVAIGAVGAGAAWVQTSRELPAPARVVPAPVAVAVDAEQRAARLRADALAGPRGFRAEGHACTEGDDQRIAMGCAVSGDPEVILPPVEPPKRVKKRVIAPVIELAPVRAAPVLDALQAESQLLALARARLRAGDLAGSEQALHQARDRFPNGSLGQEREVLQIELLAALGDREGADHRARRFLRKHPDSPHAKSVQRYLIAP
jgi:hypothetical protein